MNKVLTATDRLISKLGPLNSLLDILVARMVPHKSALACSCPYKCSSHTASCPAPGCPGNTGSRIVSVCGYASRDCFGGTTWNCNGACFC